jgi:hypothetical protein
VKAQKKVSGGSGRDKLLKELREAEADLDEQGLLFLLRQAQVLIYNAHVDRINEKSKDHGTEKATHPATAPRSEAVAIEQAGEGKPIFLTLGRIRKILTTEEMQRLVRICYAAETRSEALQHLFSVLVKERRDILADAGIGSPENPLMAELFTVIRETYRLKDR